MKLKISNCDDVGFIVYVLRFLKNYIGSSIDLRKTVLLDDYIREVYNIKEKYIDCEYIIVRGIDNLIYEFLSDGSYTIYINPNEKLNRLDAKISDVCKLINYGTLSVKGYPIFTDSIKYVQENIGVLYEMYCRGF